MNTMEELARQIGFPLSLKARDAVMKPPIGSLMGTRQGQQQQEQQQEQRDVRAVRRSSAVPLSKQQQQVAIAFEDSDNDDDDDDTASTVSLHADDTSCSSAECSSTVPSTPTVTFCAPLVTAVHVRPTITREEKALLFYTEREYREFRRALVFEKRRRAVTFHRETVTAVHQLPDHAAAAADLYYSEVDLQGFLDEFVRSLNKGWHEEAP